jgi:5-hydroxyisourate hydrolase
MSTLSTHVLDTSLGRPASGVPMVLESQGEDGTWREAGRATTDVDGRAKGLTLGGVLTVGLHRLTFDTGAYFRERGQRAFYPSVTVLFEVAAQGEHYHVPLLLSPFGYSTYRGS